MDKSFSAIYKTRQEDPFPEQFDLVLHYPEEDFTLSYEKVRWTIKEGEEEKKSGLRYGENPHQKAALYHYTGNQLTIENLIEITPIQGLSSDLKLLQSGKHPGKINIVDVDRALQILTYLPDEPAALIMKHNNPCGAAQNTSLTEAIKKAKEGDIIASFGGALVVNRPLDEEAASYINESYFEIVAAPDFSPQALRLLSQRKNLRIFRIEGMDKLSRLAGKKYLEFTSLVDGGLVLQNSYSTAIHGPGDFIKAVNERSGIQSESCREAEQRELQDLLFGWFVESGVTSNSVIFVKDGATLAIGTGEQDRVGVVKIAIQKAYRNLAEKLSREVHGSSYQELGEDSRKQVDETVAAAKGGLEGAVMVSDGFFPFRDGVDAALDEGVSAIAEPGGSLRDGEVIEACNEKRAALLFTGERSFRH